VTLTEALARSLNIRGRAPVRDGGARPRAHRGRRIRHPDADLADGPALALGASEATLLEMTGAYSGILNGGSAAALRPAGGAHRRGRASAAGAAHGPQPDRVISEDAARQLTYMMSRAVVSGTGAAGRVAGAEVAGKTGTTQAARDAWFLGFTADYVAGVWMGYDDNTPLSGVTGGGLPAEIWRQTMARTVKKSSGKKNNPWGGWRLGATGGQRDGGQRACGARGVAALRWRPDAERHRRALRHPRHPRPSHDRPRGEGRAGARLRRRRGGRLRGAGRGAEGALRPEPPASSRRRSPRPARCAPSASPRRGC
jgi:membrane peptidoglycan carboxypeptidase